MCEKNRDEYADYVMSEGSKCTWSNSRLEEIASQVSNAVYQSRPYLLNPYSAAAIECTIISAIHYSRTFQNIIGFNLLHRDTRLGNIRYSNVYELNNNIDLPEHIHQLNNISYTDIYDSTVDTVPIIMISEASERYNSNGEAIPFVNISATPNGQIPLRPTTEHIVNDYAFWQESLVHEIIHHLTGADDPADDGEPNLGPTEILARQVARDLEWDIPEFTDYHAPERESAIRQRDFRALRYAFERNADMQEEMMNRLVTIADGEEANDDFSDIIDEDGNVANQLPLPIFDEGISSLGGLFFPGASAHTTKPVTKVWNLNARIKPRTKYIVFDKKQYLTKRDIEMLNLVISEKSVSRAKNGAGFKKKDYPSWKNWYDQSKWVIPPTPTNIFDYGSGIFEYGIRLSKDYFFSHPYGLKFNDGSFSVGVLGSDVERYGTNDNWTTLKGNDWGSHWLAHSEKYAGQMFFDKNGRPVAIAITNQLYGGFGSGWSFIYKNGKWQYESKDDWHNRFFSDSSKCLDPYAARFLIE